MYLGKSPLVKPFAVRSVETGKPSIGRVQLKQLKTAQDDAEDDKNDAEEDAPSYHRHHSGDDQDQTDDPDNWCGTAAKQDGENFGLPLTSSSWGCRLGRGSIPLSQSRQPPVWRKSCPEHPESLRRQRRSSARQRLRSFSEPVLQARDASVCSRSVRGSHAVLRHWVLVSGLVAQVNTPSDVI